MSKPEPKFSVGERVLIRSKQNPESNHDNAVILQRDYGHWVNKVNGAESTGWAYKTDVDKNEHWTGEAALRPRLKPATASFDELMSAAKQIGKEQCPS